MKRYLPLKLSTANRIDSDQHIVTGPNQQPISQTEKTKTAIFTYKDTDYQESQYDNAQRLISIASILAISSTFNSLFKVLFIFPSWYLFAIGLKPIFSFR